MARSSSLYIGHLRVCAAVRSLIVNLVGGVSPLGRVSGWSRRKKSGVDE